VAYDPPASFSANSVSGSVGHGLKPLLTESPTRDGTRRVDTMWSMDVVVIGDVYDVDDDTVAAYIILFISACAFMSVLPLRSYRQAQVGSRGL